MYFFLAVDWVELKAGVEREFKPLDPKSDGAQCNTIDIEYQRGIEATEVRLD